MSTETPPAPPPRGVLCLGAAGIEMICEHHAESLADADTFAPHIGGGAAAVALLIARAGVPVTLAGGSGADDWGRWLSETLHGAGVDTFRFRMIHGIRTPLALVTVTPDGSPQLTPYAEPVATVAESLGADVEQAVAEHGALFITAASLVAPEERAVTMRAINAARELARPIIIEPNLGAHRFSSRTDAAATLNACLPGTLLLCVTAQEAELLTGEVDLERAATALRKTGAANVVVLLGADGAMLRGRIRADAPGAAIEAMHSTLGAAEALSAALLVRLAASDFYEPVLAAGLRDAVRAAAGACEHWGAVD